MIILEKTWVEIFSLFFQVETPIKKSPKSAPPMTNGKVEHHEEVSPPKPPQQKQATPPQQQQATPPQQHQQQQSPPAPQQQQQEVVPMPAAAVPVVQAAPVQPAAQAVAPPPQQAQAPPAQQAQQATPMFPPPPHMSFVPQAQVAVPPTQQPSINFLQVHIFCQESITSRNFELPANLKVHLNKKNDDERSHIKCVYQNLQLTKDLFTTISGHIFANFIKLFHKLMFKWSSLVA